MNFLILTGGFAVICVLCWLEWRRPDTRHLVRRLAATAVAAGALGTLARQSTSMPTAHTLTEAALWTSKAQSVGADIEPFERFTLPDAIHIAALDAKVIPDAAALRRLRPDLRSLVIYGDGLDPAELPALNGLHVEFLPPVHAVAAAPGVVFLRCPRTLALGEPLVVAGRLGGVPGGARFPLVLEAPDGSKVEGTADAANATGEATFTLRAPALAAAGRYIWQLRVGQTSEPLGVAVVAPTLPRVLVLEAGPRFDTTALRRWYESAGGSMTVRTQVGRERFRYASSQGTAPQFAALDAVLLTNYDLVLADGRAIAALGTDERTALRVAVENRGVGLLLRTDDDILPADAKISFEGSDIFAPWKLLRAADLSPGDERLVRPHWWGQATTTDLPVPAVPFNIEPSPGQDVLVDDRRDHALVAATHRGRGQIALTLVGDTTRWQRDNDFAAFAAYWSFLFERLAGPSEGAVSRWSLGDGDGGPVFVDHPLQLRRTGSPENRLNKAAVTEAADGSTTPLSLARDPREPGVWHGTFWPRHGGWHRVSDESGDTGLNFFVHPASDWPALQAARRRLATARFADASRAREVRPPVASARDVSPGWWWAVFVVSAGYLWLERRLAGGRSVLENR